MDCSNCIYLNKSMVRYDKNNKQYQYGCYKDGYTPKQCSKDSDLKICGCGYFRSKIKNVVLHPGDVVEWQKFQARVKYMYLGIKQGKRLMYGGRIDREEKQYKLFDNIMGKTMLNDPDFRIVGERPVVARRLLEEYDV